MDKVKLSVFTIVLYSLLTNCKNIEPQPTNSISYKRDAVYAILWQQVSGEYRALAFQAYNIARLRLDQAVIKNRKNERLAIVVDVDETILNNSAFNGHMVVNDLDYSKTEWGHWVNKVEADTVPGACAFLKYAATKKNIEVFYITNRSSADYLSTLKNLQKFNFPFTDSLHILVSDSSDKEPRRLKIAKDYKIILLCGDNLNDFSNLFYGKSFQQRMSTVDSVQNYFGNIFIVLPNAMYGDWESAIYDYATKLADSEKAEMRINQIKRY